MNESKNIYTGYFSNLEKYIENNLFPISICGKAPDWYTGTQYKKLAPSWDIFSKYKSDIYSESDYETHFLKERLGILDKNIVIQELYDKTEKDIVLLCYEKPGKFCHRHTVANWLSEITNITEFNLHTNKNLVEYFQ